MKNHYERRAIYYYLVDNKYIVRGFDENDARTFWQMSEKIAPNDKTPIRKLDRPPLGGALAGIVMTPRLFE